MNVKQADCAEINNDVDLEDGEIYDEEAEAKAAAEPVPEKPEAEEAPVAPPQDQPSEGVRGSLEDERPLREQRVPFFRPKRKHMFDDTIEEDGRWKRGGKRNRRGHEFEREGLMRDREGEAGEDEEEMMLVRGASPHRLPDDKWDREGEEEREREREREGPRRGRSFRGRGTLGRRGDRQTRGRGRGRGSVRANKRKRENEETCIYFLQGKCHRGGDCPFAHEILPPRKMELCKFYMKDCCAKKDKCLYMHSEFPCKYFHTGLKCYANKKCKFSHGVLNDTMRNILAKHLDTAPKDILGEFPRRDRDMRDRDVRDRDMRNDSRDMRNDPHDMRGDPRDMRNDQRNMRGDMRNDLRDMRHDMRDMRNDPRDMGGDLRDMRNDQRNMRGDMRNDLRDMRNDLRDMRNEPRDLGGDMREMRGDFMRQLKDRDRKIPSLFDIKVSIPDDLRSQDGSHTPMPSPTQRSQDSTRSSDRDRDNYSPGREREREKGKEREKEKERHEKAERSKERKAKREKAREHRKERKERKEREKEKKRERSKDAHIEKQSAEDIEGHDSSEIMSPPQTEGNIWSGVDIPLPDEKVSPEELDKKSLSLEDTGLLHLPKKQRELFLRIQQQQREADSSQASANDEEEDDKITEENWYSSDEETPMTCLPSVLRSLTASSAPPTASSAHSAAVMPLLSLLASASAAAKPLPLEPKPAPAPPSFLPPNLDLSNLSTVFEALTNLQKMSSATNNLAELQQTNAAASPDRLVMDIPSPEPYKPPEPARVRDPRLRSEGGSTESQRGSEDVDLRPKAQTPASPVDVDLRSLPFKPVQHTAACEIDASLTAHQPIVWLLTPAHIVKADYASLHIQPKPGVNDPRLRRVTLPPTDELGLPRDPRQRLDDPRQRQVSGPPPTPRYEEVYRSDSDMRQFPPPTPRLEDEAYTPGPSRPVDPRQRRRPDDIDLRHPMPGRVPFVNYN